jgi:peptidyl-prolyl cis-trans isomerase D
MRDEGRNIRFLMLERRVVAERIEISDQEVRASYDANQASYSHPEQRRASHILIRVAPDANDQDRATMRAVAEALLARVNAGEDFAELARANSQDPGSAERGGDLDFFGRGQMVPPFEEAAFNTPVGQVAPLVESDFGYHIIKVTDAREAGVTPLEEVADQIRRTLRLRRAQEEVVSETQRIRAELQDAGQIEEVAASEGLEIQSRFVTREDRLTDLGASPEFVETVFDLEPGVISPPLRSAPGMALVVVDEVLPPAVPPLEEVRSLVSTDILNDRARRAALETGRRALERHDTFARAVAALGQEVEDSGDLAPGASIPRSGGSTPEMEQALFGPGVMEGDSGVVEVPAGALVYEVIRRQPFDSLAFEDSKADLREELLQQRRMTMYRSLVEQMHRQQDVQINGELVEAYNG